jgi:hypothetical protein
MNPTPKTDGPHNCIGCELWQTIGGDDSSCCMNAISWDGDGTPENPPCFEYAPEFLAAIDKRRELADALGEEHPDTMRAMMLAMELAPPHIHAMMGEKARELDLMPEADGYLDDGSPMYRLDDIAERLGVPLEEAAEAMHTMLAEREALGLSNDGIVKDAARIHRRQ